MDTIAAASFYSRRSGGESDSDERRGLTVLSSALAASGLKTTAVKSGGDSRSKAAARKSSRPVIDKPTGRNSTGGRKRKRTGGLGVAGVSHAIKRPKKRPCLEPVKISEKQLNAFRDIVDVTPDADDLESESDNFRALQPLNERHLLEVVTGDGDGSDAETTSTSITTLAALAFLAVFLSSKFSLQ